MARMKAREEVVAALLLVVGVSLAALAGVEASVADFKPVYIDCGSTTEYIDPTTGITWQADAFFMGNGTTAQIPTGSRSTLTGELSVVDQTLRTWSSGDSCYKIPVAAEKGRYLIRLSFCYNNYDGDYVQLYSKTALPSIGVSVEGYFVEAVAGFGQSDPAYYTDYIVTVTDGYADICLSPLQSSSAGLDDVSPPFINSIQVLPVDSELFLQNIADDVVLSGWARINCGGSSVVPNATDAKGYRTWYADYRNDNAADVWTSESSAADIVVPSEYIEYAVPQDVLRFARKAPENANYTGYLFSDIHPVNVDNEFLVILYIAQLDDSTEDRMEHIEVNAKFNDLIFYQNNEKLSTSLNVMMLTTTLANLTEGDDGWQGLIQAVAVNQWPGKAGPIINGIEIYEIIKPYERNTSEAFKMRIDCGGGQNYYDVFNNLWQADQFFSSGRAANALKPKNALTLSTTLRYFSGLLSGKQNCYSVPVPSSGLYLIRGFFDFGSWSNPSEYSSITSPTFGFGVEGVVLSSFTPDAPGFFRSVLAYVNDGVADLCVYGDGQVITFINSVEVLQVDAASYNATKVDVSPSDQTLYLFTRINSGGSVFGDLLSNDTEGGMRQWTDDVDNLIGTCLPEPNSDSDLESACAKVVTAIVSGVNEAPYFWPPTLFASQIEGEAIEYNITVFPNATILLYLHFAETNTSVQEGNRVFTVSVNGAAVTLYNAADHKAYTDVDVLAIAGAGTALAMYAKISSGSLGAFDIVLSKAKTSTFPPMVSGLEVYGVYEKVNMTEDIQATTMNALKKSLEVPEELGWQGDPCVPYPWAGVTCADDSGKIVIALIELSSMGLVGTLSSDVMNLSALKTLNLSDNSLTGDIPNTLGDIDGLIKLDLSDNKFTGKIPEEIASIPSLRYLKLENNNLEGQLPSDLIPVPSSVEVDYSGNPYLCGGNGLQDCANVPPFGVPLPPIGPPTSSGGGGGDIGMIAGAIAGVAVILAVAGVVALLVIRRRRARRVPLAMSGEERNGGLPSRLTMEP